MPRCRPFKLVDAMILVAVSAFGMTSMHPGWKQFQMFWAGTKRAPTWQAYVGMAHTSLTIAFLNLAVAYVWIRLIPPRLPSSDLIRQPGMLFLTRISAGRKIIKVSGTRALRNTGKTPLDAVNR